MGVKNSEGPRSRAKCPKQAGPNLPYTSYDPMMLPSQSLPTALSCADKVPKAPYGPSKCPKQAGQQTDIHCVV